MKNKFINPLKKQFPIFKNNPGLVYLDNASTTQKPERVINSIVEYYSKYNANVHRGLYPLSDKSTQLYEDARKTIAEFINADLEEVIFVGGTTDGINSIAQSLIRSKLVKVNPKIIITEFDHHSNILPWQSMSPSEIYYIQRGNNEQLKRNNNKSFLPNESEIDIVSFPYISNVTGTIFPIKEIVSESEGAYTLLDAAQAIGHIPIDVKELGVDFMVFSGHKMYGPTGIGVIYAKREILKKMEPFRVGGGMITEVKRSSSKWANLPQKFEAGTPPISEAIALAEAVRFINDLGFPTIIKHEHELRKYLISELQEIRGVNIYHPNIDTIAGGVISIALDNLHPHDISQFLGEDQISVRAGHHCTQILHREIFKVPATLRISLGIYNDLEDINRFLIKLKEGITFFRK